MARVWPMPACSSGSCMIFYHLKVHGCQSPSTDGMDCGCANVANEAACASIAHSWELGNNSTYQSGPCMGQVQYEGVATYEFRQGNVCCTPVFPPSGCRTGGVCSRNLIFPDCTEQEYIDCCASEHKSCNPGYCLPATQTDPVECYNLTPTCAGAIPGASLVPSTPGDPNRPTYCLSLSDNRCGGQGCCLCDRFCPLDANTCAALGGQPVANAAACKAANIKPKCIRAAWRLGIRPNAHYANMTRGVAPHRMSLFSKQTTKDLPSGECKTYYGWTQRHATRGMMHGAICNQFNKGCPNTRTARKLKLVRHPSKGMMRFEGKYRKPCPEQSDMGCATTVGCP